MVRFGYHASHEQFAPSELLRLVQRAERAGFDAAMCSDHFHPWSERQGESGFAWSWLGAALQATRLTLGTVTAPGQRYHPAVIAQAVATLAQMHGDRFWIAVGTGEALNECMTGMPWPAKHERNARLREAVDVMRALWRGEETSHHGHFIVDRARLYSLPERPPRLFAAALGPETARWAGGWADGLITISMPRDKLRGVLDAFREGGGEGKPVRLQVKLSWAPTAAEARDGAFEQWRTNVFDAGVSEDLRTPAQFEAAAKYVRPEDVAAAVRISDSLEQHVEWLQQDLEEAGVDQLLLHNVNRGQAAFIDAFAGEVLPRLRAGTKR